MLSRGGNSVGQRKPSGISPKDGRFVVTSSDDASRGIPLTVVVNRGVELKKTRAEDG